MKRSRQIWHIGPVIAALAFIACAPGEDAGDGAATLDATAASQEAADTTREPATIEWTQPRPDVVAAPPLVDSAATEARLTVLEGVHRVVLPPAAYDALQRGAPDFEPWTPGHYAELLFQYEIYDFDERQAMSTVVADFDGDDRRDVVMQGPDGGKVLTLALLSGDGDWQYQEVSRQDPYPGELEARNSQTFLMYLPPGRYEEAEYLRRPPVELEAAGFQVVLFEKGYVMYYLRDGEWRRLD